MHDPEVTLLYVKGLKSKDNSEVNRAAAALKALGDVSAVPPLIDALVTTHKAKIGSGNPGQTSASFSRGSGGNIGFGGGGWSQDRQAAGLQSPGPQCTGRPDRPELRVPPRRLARWYAAQRRSQAIESRRD